MEEEEEGEGGLGQVDGRVEEGRWEEEVGELGLVEGREGKRVEEGR